MILLVSTSHMVYLKSDFQNVAIILQATYEHYPCAPASPITYNPQKETITLRSFSESKVKEAMTELQLLVERFSKRWGGKYLVTSRPFKSRALKEINSLVLKSSSARSSTNPSTTRVFPIIPKESPDLVKVWYKSILPALPPILSPTLGENYAASLVRRGHSDFRAQPCIQIESPCIPGLTTQRIIKDLLNEVWKKDGFEPISMHFTKGSVKKLNGGEEENDDDGAESDKLWQRLELNYNRPYSKPGMGASVGLLCSRKLSATLGGYVLIGGEKYMLTSEHFVSKSRGLANRDGNEPDCVTLISPSREDLEKIENNLKQTKRDLDSEINLLVRRNYHDRDYPEHDFSDSNDDKLREATRRNDEVISLLDQVTKRPLEYAVGTVKKFSLERRTEIISRSLANDVGLRNDQLMVKHQMDWALFRTNSQTAQTGENRHKYRSNQDAIDDHYVDESNHADPAGDVCHETCGAEAGYTVYYVGQRSKRRSGLVHMPTLHCKDSAETLAWGISDLDGYEIPASDVAGDSGAWVIREDGNKLMGQVHSHGQGRVLFTPIDVIFADLKAKCESDVSLPPCPRDQRQISSAIHVTPLCSYPQMPPVRSYGYLKLDPVASTTDQEPSPVGIALAKIRDLESSGKIHFPSDTKSVHGRRPSNPSCGSSPSLPSLTQSPQSSVSTLECPDSPQSSESGDTTYGPGDIEKLPSNSLPITFRGSSMSEISDLSLDERSEDQTIDCGSYSFQSKTQSLFRKTSSTRTPTWPIGLESGATKARRGSGIPRLRTPRDSAVNYVARSVLHKFARFARRVGTCACALREDPQHSNYQD